MLPRRYPLSFRPLCERCCDERRWGRSPLCGACLHEAQLLVDAAGVPTDPMARQRGELWAARYRYRRLRRGGWYVYRVWRAGGRAHERYLGTVDHEGDPYELPALRSPSPTRSTRRS